jgi:hypothetical protein
VILVATSNDPPDKLYWNGLQRERFLPAIESIKTHTVMINLDGDRDYRLCALEQAEIYHSPLDRGAEHSLTESFEAIAAIPGRLGEDIEVMTPSQSEGLDGCEQPQGLPGLKFNHSLELAVLVRSLGIKLLLISDVLPNLFLLKSNGRDRIASCPKLLPIKIPFPCSKLPSHRNGRFPLEVSNHPSNGVLWGNPY